MLEVRERELSSWNEFKTDLEKHLFGEGPPRRERFIFRGQGDSQWKLRTSFDRRFETIVNPAERYAMGQDLYYEFVNELRRLDVTKDVPNNDTILLSLAQHYGMPTRLLDWTKSQYTAAFFAFEKHALGKGSGSVAVYALDVTNRVWDTPNGLEVVEPYPFGNIRLRNQSGIFTLSRILHDTLDEYVAANDGVGDPLFKFILPASEARRAMADLDAMGVNYAYIFPDVEGVARLAVFRTALKYGITIDWIERQL